MNNTPNQMPDAGPAPEFRQCFGCNYEAVTDQTICPRCRKKAFYTSGSIRIRGVVIMVLGLFLAGLMGGVSVFVGMLLMGAMDNPDSARKIADGQLMLIGIFGLFALLIVLGLHFVVTGGWMTIFGRRNPVLVWIMWVFIALVIVVGGVISILLD